MSRIALSANPFVNDQYAAPTTSAVLSAMSSTAQVTALVPSLSFSNERLALIEVMEDELSPTRDLLSAPDLTACIYNRINETNPTPVKLRSPLE
jgi:hypothetical protein